MAWDREHKGAINLRSAWRLARNAARVSHGSLEEGSRRGVGRSSRAAPACRQQVRQRYTKWTRPLVFFFFPRQPFFLQTASGTTSWHNAEACCPSKANVKEGKWRYQSTFPLCSQITPHCLYSCLHPFHSSSAVEKITTQYFNFLRNTRAKQWWNNRAARCCQWQFCNMKSSRRW